MSHTGDTPAGPPLLLGLDVGGTSVRCLVAEPSGRRVGTGQAAGANPNAVGLPTALEHIAEAVSAALRGLDRARVVASVMGAAGFGTDQGVAEPARDLWARLGVGGSFRLVGDALVGFCAGTDATNGTIIISGTGAGAIEIEALTQGLVCDAAGWLLGDDGSGQWVGREAVRHTVRPSRDLPNDPLSRAVREAVLGRADARRDELVRALYAGPPLALSALAPVVVGLARDGDDDARRILVAAAALLERSTSLVRATGDTTPIVLTGGLFASEVLLEAFTQRLHQHWPGAPVLRSGSGAGGAAWLAAHDLAETATATGTPDAALHAALTRLPLAVDA